MGYGNRTFYLKTPTWGDLTMRNAFLAAFGRGRSLMHADHDHDPRREKQRPITLTHEEYRRLVAFARASFQRDSQGPHHPSDRPRLRRFRHVLRGGGPYSAVYTCNEWTGRALREAGVRTGVWTPLSQSIMWRL
jgi:uncharacterized protein (TIGR02117 family)